MDIRYKMIFTKHTSKKSKNQEYLLYFYNLNKIFRLNLNLISIIYKYFYCHIKLNYFPYTLQH